ncbi:radical SAM protein [Candidatus Woesearchaeota archaeon]|nr:radical SAM protein [Candidatus Woesearchaeota archaeon]
MVDVVLINPRYQYVDFGDDLGIHQPLGLMQLGSHLIHNGISAKLIDANASGIQNDSVADAISKHDAKLALITVPTILFPQAVKIANDIKEKYPGMLVIAGGAHFMSMPHTLKGTPFDAAFGAAEADTIIVKLAKEAVENNKIDYSTPGLIYYEDEKFVRNPNPPLIPKDQFDSIPHPYKYANEMGFDMSLYKGYANTAVYGKGHYASLITSRGCVYKCTFCLEAEVFGRTHRAHSAEYVYNMMLDMEKLGAKEFYFMDSEWSIPRRRNMEFMQMIINDKKDWRWECLSRSTDFNDNTRDYPKTMKKAGCISVGMGVESGSDETLKRIKKDATKDDYRKAFKILRECGIERRGSFMMGYPWETAKDLYDTLKFAIELDPDFVYFQPYVPYMNTPLYEEAKRFVKIDAATDFDKWWQHSIVGGKVIMSTIELSSEDITRINAEAYKKFYYRPSYIMKQILRSWDNPYRLKVMAKNGITLMKQIIKRTRIENQAAPEIV